MLVYKDSKRYVENSLAYAPDMTIDSGDETEEATADLWACGKFSVTGRVHEQTFAHLSYKIRENFLTYTRK